MFTGHGMRQQVTTICGSCYMLFSLGILKIFQFIMLVAVMQSSRIKKISIQKRTFLLGIVLTGERLLKERTKVIMNFLLVILTNIFRLLSIRCFYLFINLSKWHTRSIAKNVNIWKDPFLHSLLLYMVEAMMFKCHLDIFKCSGWLTSLSLDPCGIHLCWLLYVIEMMEIQNLCTLPSILYWSNILLCTNSISQ